MKWRRWGRGWWLSFLVKDAFAITRASYWAYGGCCNILRVSWSWVGADILAVTWSWGGGDIFAVSILVLLKINGAFRIVYQPLTASQNDPVYHRWAFYWIVSSSLTFPVTFVMLLICLHLLKAFTCCKNNTFGYSQTFHNVARKYGVPLINVQSDYCVAWWAPPTSSQMSTWGDYIFISHFITVILTLKWDFATVIEITENGNLRLRNTIIKKWPSQQKTP